jgi:glucose/mannose-6-phosphate isomerase
MPPLNPPSQILDQEERLKAVDKSNMLGTIGRFPEMAREALSFKIEGPPQAGLPQNAVIAGMGGSGISAEILLGTYSGELSLPVLALRGYHLPGFAGPKTLVTAISYSGSTEETLSVLKSAEKQKAQIAVITSGGKLREIAESKNYSRLIVPAGLQPRAALGYLFFALLALFEAQKLLSVSAKDKEETIQQLFSLRENYAPSVPSSKNRAKQLAMKIAGKIPLVLGAEGITAAAAYRWKTQFNENSSAVAFCSQFPELNHNEIVGLDRLKRGEHNFALLVLREEKDHERIKKRIEITKSLLAAKLGGVIEVWAEGSSPLAKMFSLIFLGDYVSAYVAVLLGIDPSEIEVINRLKKELLR